MFNITLGLVEVHAALTRIVNRFGVEHAASAPVGNTSCIYAVRSNGVLTPVCIVGQWLADMGLLGVVLSEDEVVQDNGYINPTQEGACTPGASRIWPRLELLGIHVTEEAQGFLRRVQEIQDSGLDPHDEDPDRRWGTALNVATQEYHEQAIAALPTAALVASAFDVPAQDLADWERELLYGNPWDASEAQAQDWKDEQSF